MIMPKRASMSHTEPFDFRALIHETDWSVFTVYYLVTCLREQGFRVTRLQKHDFFNLWELRFEQPSDSVSRDLRQMRRLLREIILKTVFESSADDLMVQIKGRRVLCVFRNPFGEVMALGPAERRGRL
jgi:hypothetical protein